jgi:alpha-N-arabinofuranosidase
MPQFSSTMTHAVYMASQWLRYADTDVGWIMANALVPAGLRGVLGGVDTGFVYSAEAKTREILKPVFRPGAFLTKTRISQQTYLTAPDGSTWPVLMVGGATTADGTLHVVVVNRHPHEPQVARIVPAGFQRERTVAVAQVSGDSFLSFMDDGTFGGDNSVTLTRSTTQTKGQGSFEHEFPAASITVLALQPR